MAVRHSVVGHESRPRCCRAKGRLRLVNQFFWPDGAATAQLLADLAEDAAGSGWSVSVVTGRGGYALPGGVRLGSRERWRGVAIDRIWTPDRTKGLLGAALAYLAFLLPVVWRAMRWRRDEIVVTLSTPPFVSVVGWLARVRGAKFVYKIEDLYPDVALALGVLHQGGLARGLERAARFITRRADRVVVLDEGMRRTVAAQRGSDAGVVVIPNWADETDIRPKPTSESQIRQELALGSHELLVGYAGNFGRAHRFDALLEAIAVCEARSLPIRFLFTGAGSEAPRIQAAARTSGTLTVGGYVARHELGDLLAAADIQIVSLRSEVEGLLYPSKVAGILAAGRPILFLGNPHGDVAREIREHAVGWVAPHDPDAICACLEEILSSREEREIRGQHARTWFDKAYSRSRTSAAWLSLLEDVRAERMHLREAAGDECRPERGGRRAYLPLQGVSGGGVLAPALSIVVPVRNEVAHLDRFFTALASLRDGGRAVELLLAEGGSQDGTSSMLAVCVKEFSARRPKWSCGILNNSTGSIPDGLNGAIQASSGLVVFRLDAHTIYPEDYLEKCLETLAATGAQNVGGVVRATPAADTATARAIACARNDLFATGPGSFRTESSSGPRRSVPFGCFPRSTFERFGLYDERLLRNQDLALNHRIVRGGGTVYRRGDLLSLYIAPARFGALFRKHLANGWWNVCAAAAEPGCIGPKHAIPGVVLAIGLVLLATWPVAVGALAGGLLLADALRALFIARGRDAHLVAWAFVVAQTGHALGQIAGAIAMPWIVWSQRGRDPTRGRRWSVVKSASTNRVSDGCASEVGVPADRADRATERAGSPSARPGAVGGPPG